MVECPNCGAEVSSSDKRCSKCGEKLKNKSNNLIIGIIIAVVIIAIVGVFASGILASGSDVNVNDDSANALNTDSQNDSVVYWASTNSTKFHKPNCEWAQKIKESNKVVYHSRDDAISDGREPCGACNP